MEKSKRLVNSLLVYFIILSLLLTACGGSNSSSNSTSSANSDNNAGIAKSAGIGTQPVGSSFYALGTGIAKIITENTQTKTSVIPYAGADAFMPDIDDGKLTLAILSAIDMGWAYNGQQNYDKPHKKMRMVVQGNYTEHATITVRADSNIKSISDLKGKKVGDGYGGNKLTQQLQDAALASVGLSRKDIIPVPLTDSASALRALEERRVDATYSGSITMPAAVQLDQSIGIRVLPIGNLKPADVANGTPADMQKILDQYVPGAILKAAPAKGTLKEETVLIHYPINLATSSDLSEETVYQIVKALWEHYEELALVHAWGAQWTPKTFVVENQPAPYHDGAVKFFKEKGVWTDAMQKRQDELLKSN